MINIGQNILHLLIVFVIPDNGFSGIGMGEGIDHDQQFQEGRLFYDIVGVTIGGGYLADVVKEAALRRLIQGNLVLKAAVTVGKAVVQIRIRCG